MRHILMLCLPCLVACSSPDGPPPPGKGGPAVIAASLHSVVLSPVSEADDPAAMVLAAQECEKFKRVADNPRMLNGDTVSYMCSAY